jgi:hypothetical protein
MGCLWIRCVVCGSEPPSHPRGVPIQLAGLSWRVEVVRARHGAAVGVSGGCDVWDVRTLCPPSLSDLQRCKSTEP